VNARRPRAVGIFLLLGTIAAASAVAASLPHRVQLNALYKADHEGTLPHSDADLAPYSAQFQRILGRCTITSSDLANATLYMAGHVSKQPGAAPVSNLAMMTAINRHITWAARKSCWDLFNSIQANMAAQFASKLILNRHQLGALYAFDHVGQPRPNDSQLLPYSRAFERIHTACTTNIDDLPTQLIELSDKASELGARTVTSLAMMKAVGRRISWKGRRDCNPVFDDAEGHMEAGGP
jgi:hypothetical protein